MADFTSKTSQNNYTLRLSITENSVNVTANTSNVTVTLAILSDQYGARFGETYTSASLVVDGETKVSFSNLVWGNSDVSRGSPKIVGYPSKSCTWTGDIPHNTDGKKTLTCSASFSTSITDYSPGYGSVSGSIELTAIPRQSSFSVSPATLTLDEQNTLSVTIDRKVSSYHHTVAFYSGTQKVEEYTNIATGKTITPTYSDWLSKISTKDTRTLSAASAPSVRVTTYDASGNQIGVTAQNRFDILLPENSSTKPTLTCTLSPSGSLPAAFAGLYVQTKTAVAAQFTGSSAKAGASIKEYAMVIQGTTYAGITATSAVLGVSGDLPVTVRVTDSRGISTSETRTITVQSYAPPFVGPYSSGGTTYGSVICTRCTSDGTESYSGTYLLLKCQKGFSSVGGKNKCSMKLEYKLTSATAYSSKGTISSESAASAYSGILSGVVSDASKAYDIRITVTDTIGSTGSYSLIVQPDSCTLHLAKGGKAVGIGGYNQSGDGTVDIFLEPHIRDGNDFPTLVDYLRSAILQSVYAVGTLYCSSDSTNPRQVLGFGTWEKIEGKYLYAANAAHPFGSTFGEETHTLTVNEMPSHQHKAQESKTHAEGAVYGRSETGQTTYAWGTTGGGYAYLRDVNTSLVGGGAAHNNMPPGYAIHIWRRTA